MNSNEKTLLYALLGALVLGIVLWLALRKKPTQVMYLPNPNLPTGEKGEEQGKDDTPVRPITPFPLKQGSKGREVEQLQMWLAKQDASIKADGIFGPKTEASLFALKGIKTVSNNVFKENSMGGFQTKVYPNP